MELKILIMSIIYFMKRKSCRNGFITALPRHSLQKSPLHQQNQITCLRENVKSIMNRLPHGSITQNAIHHSGLSSSAFFNYLSRNQVPTSIIELRKMKENLIVVEKQVQKLKSTIKRQPSEDSQSRKAKKRRKVEEYKKWKQDRKSKFSEDEFMRLQIVKELNYRKKMQKFMRTDHQQNKNSFIKEKADRMHEINSKVTKTYEKQKEKQKNSHDYAMTLFRNRTQELEQKKDKIKTINTSGHERKFVKIVEYKNKSLKIDYDERKNMAKSMDEKGLKEKWAKRKEKIEQINNRRQEMEEKSFQSKIKRAIQTKNRIQKFHIEGVKVEKKKKQQKRMEPDVQEKLDEMQRKIFQSVDERVRRKEEYLFNKTQMMKQRVQKQKTRILLKKQVLSRQSNERADKVYESAIAIKKRHFNDQIEDKIREKHDCVLARNKFNKRALNLRSQSTSCLIKKLTLLENKQKKHQKQFNFY